MGRLSRIEIAQFANCEGCRLYQGAKTPFMRGVGSSTARVVVVGEAPGRGEDAAGKPFVGLSGQFLRGCLTDTDIPEDSLFFTNTNRCWPGLDEKGGDAKATDKQVRCCAPATIEEIRRIGPKAVLLVGGQALKGVLGLAPIGQHRGSVIERDGILYIPTYHPSYVLRETRNLRPGEMSRATEAWISDLNLLAGALTGDSRAPVPPFPIVPTSSSEVRALLREARKSRMAAFDYETTGLDPYQKGAKLLTAAVAWRDPAGELKSMFIPLNHRQSWWDHLSWIEIQQDLREFLLDPKLHLFGSNLKFEFVWSALHLGVEFRGFPWSTDLMHALIDPRKDPGHSLKTLASLVGYGGYDQPFEDYMQAHTLVPSKKKGIWKVRKIRKGERVPCLTKGDMEWMPLDEICTYNAADVYVNYLLFEHLAPILDANDHLYVYKHITANQITTLGRMELAGLKLSVPEHRRQQLAVNRRIREYQSEMEKLPKVKRFEAARAAAERHTWETSCGGFGEDGKTWTPAGTSKSTKAWPLKWTDKKTGNPVPLKFSSGAQLKDYFYGYLGYEHVLATKTGPTLDRDDLARLASKRDGLAAVLGKFRKASKQKEAFLDPAMIWVKPDGKVRTTHRISGTEAGRVSAGSDKDSTAHSAGVNPGPNIQQIPREGEGVEIKRMFISSFDRGFLVEADQGQIEPRLIACHSQDKRMLEIVRNRKADIHTAFTAMAWKIPLEQVTKPMRQQGKSIISLGTLYGQEAQGLAAHMGWTLARAREFLAELWGMLPGVAAWQERTKREAFDSGYASTRIGRRRYLPDIRSSDGYLAGVADRQAVNMRIQGLASDIVQYQGMLVDRGFQARKLRSRLVVTVHDSLMADTPPEETVEAAVILRSIMEDTSLLPKRFALTVPLQADLKIGPSWGTAQEISSRKFPEEADFRAEVARIMAEA